MRIRRSLKKYYLVILNPMQIWKVLPSKKLPLIHKQILTLGDLNAIKKVHYRLRCSSSYGTLYYLARY